ncbi:MAG: ComEA family DNA-binding protein [Chloroflexi bacterium]|nr:ComEA family DNA-binding protein [Chloroflexota bacterium]
MLLAIAAFLLAFTSGAGGIASAETGTAQGFDSISVAFSGAPSEGVASSVDGTPRLVVEVVGAIDKPGVYRLPAGSRVGDLIEAAGGYGPRVDTDRVGRELNLAAPLRDGDQVRVPSRDDAVAAGSQGHAEFPGSGGGPALVDLNNATATELDALPGIGPVTAAKIIAAREEQPFASPDDLRARKLVGEKTFANLKDLVTVR